MFSGLGSQALAPWLPLGSSVSFLSWNARAFCHHRPRMRRRKIEFLRSFLPKSAGSFAVIALQEVHGTPEKISRMLYDLRRQYLLFSSFTPCEGNDIIKEDAGSVLTLIPKGSCTSSASAFSASAVVPGRVLRVKHAQGWIHWNVHNFGLTHDEVDRVSRLIIEDAAFVHANPAERFMTVAGDFNFLPPGETQRCIRSPDIAGTGHGEVAGLRPFQNIWQRCLDRLTEIQQPYETHFHSGSNTISRLDRLYVASPPWLSLQLGLQGRLLCDPVRCHELQLSDHSPVAFVFRCKQQLPPEQRPIPRYVVDHPRFSEILSSLTGSSNWHRLSLPLRLPQFKAMIREAARLTRNEILAFSCEASPSHAQILASIARAVWHKDARLARTLLSSSPLARQHLLVVAGKISIIDPVEFASAYDGARSAILEARRQRIKYPRRRKLEAIDRLAKIWSPFGKQLPISAIKVGENLMHDESAQLSALADAWSPTFSEVKPINSQLAEAVAEKFSSSFDFSSFSPPSSSFIHFFLLTVESSSPGVDGIPYRAWLHAGPVAWQLLHQVAVWLCAGLGMMSNFNETLMIFIPKGEEPGDESGVVRGPLSTRPLGLKNSDVKCISGAIHKMTRGVFTQHASLMQNGFVHRRNFLNNIVDLDTAARIYSMQEGLHMPILLFTDFGAAFPSLIREWLSIVLRCSNVPNALINFIEGIHDSVVAVGRVGCTSVTLFLILSGVIQGCPLASFCFVIAFDPFLNLFRRSIVDKGKGLVRACADDVGAVFKSVEVLPAASSIFKLAGSLAGLHIKISKCAVVPLRPWSPTVAEYVQSWLSSRLPLWSEIRVVPCAKYLGTFMGPSVGDLVWRSAVSKWTARVSAIAATGAPPSVAVNLYNKFAVPCLSYVGQLSFPPRSLLTREAGALARLLHAPPQAFGLADFHSLRHWGSVGPCSVLVTLAATIIRASYVSISVGESN